LIEAGKHVPAPAVARAMAGKPEERGQEPFGFAQGEQAPAERRRLKPALPDAAIVAALILITLAAYIRTMRPTFGWGDSSELITAAYFLGVGHSPGYPLWMLIMHPFSHIPIGSVAFRLNFVDALFGSIGVALLYLVYRAISGSRPAAFIAALTFAFSPTFWDQTTEVDVHTLHVCLASAILLIVFAWRSSLGAGFTNPADAVRLRRTVPDRWLYLLSWVIGISLGNHALISLMIPAILYLVWAERGRRYFTGRRVAACFGLFLLGLSIYVYMPIRGAANPPPHQNNPHNLSEMWAQVTAPGARAVMFDRGLVVPLIRARNNIAQLPWKFTFFGSALALLGIGLLWRRDRRLAVFLVLLAGFDVGYAMNFSIFDIYTYYLPMHLVWAAFIAVGAAALIAYAGRLMERIPASMLSPKPAWRFGPTIALLLALPVMQFLTNLPTVDGSQDWGSERFARAVFKEAEKNALVLADWWTIAPMGYLKYIEGQRRDLVMFAGPSMYADTQFVDFSREEFIGRYKVIYFVEMLTYRIGVLRDKYYLVPEGPIYRVYLHRPAPETLLEKVPDRPIARFGDRVGLVRAEVSSKPLRPGECFDFTIYWTPLEGYNRKKHEAILVLENKKSGRIWQESNVLGYDLYPLEQWKPGEVLTEKHRIYLPDPVPNGEYNLYLRVRERGKSHCLDCDKHPADGNARDYRIGRVKVEQAPAPSAAHEGIPAVVALLRP